VEPQGTSELAGIVVAEERVDDVIAACFDDVELSPFVTLDVTSAIIRSNSCGWGTSLLKVAPVRQGLSRWNLKVC
jgi:hypothetical protein